MTALGFAIAGAASGNPVEADANGNLNVNLPTTNSQAGFNRLTALAGAAYNDAEITEEGKLSVAQSFPLLTIHFNGNQTVMNAKIGISLTTMTRSLTNGFLVLNNGGITTTTTGAVAYSQRVINIDEAGQVRARMYAKTVNATATNKQADLGLGYFNVTSGQAAAMNEFIGFRWTTTGGMLGVVETSQGGAPTTQTININANIPFADNITYEYELLITEDRVKFFVNGVYQGTINRPTGSWSVTKGVSLPWVARVFNSGVASAGMQLALGVQDIQRYQADMPPAPFIAAGQGKASAWQQFDLGMSAVTHNAPASGTAPTANAGSNTASALNNTAQMGGFYRNTLTGVTVTPHTNVLFAAFLNPIVPTSAGVATNSRNFIVTGISISPMVVTTALTGGGFTAEWFVAIGCTAVSLATSNVDGSAGLASRAPNILPLNLITTLAAAAAAGTTSTDVGDHQFVFPTPLVIEPGSLLHIGFRTLFVTAAVTVGAVDGGIYVNGYWE